MKLQVPFIQLPITFDARALQAEIESIDEGAWRGRTAREDGNSALTLITAGGDASDDALSGEMRATPWLQQLSYTRQVLASLGATLGRARLMRLNGQAEVKAHVDINYYWRERMRVHIPIVTTPEVRFQCGEGETHMGAGECWIFDTWRRHRVVNGGMAQRVHLVVDTVGGEHFWELLVRGRSPGHALKVPWAPDHVAPAPEARHELSFECFNVPVVMSPWELREHIVFLLGEAVGDSRLPAIQQALLRFARNWHALWSAFGAAARGRTHYQALLDRATCELEGLGIGRIGLKNEIGLWHALRSHVFDMALASEEGLGQQDVHGQAPSSRGGNVAVPGPGPGDQGRGHARPVIEPRFHAPIFIVSPPRSGSTLLFETLVQSPDIVSLGDEGHRVVEGMEGLAPFQRDFHSNRLLAADASEEVCRQLRLRFAQGLRDREGRAPQDGPLRMLEKTPKNSLRVPFLARAFPDARFIYLHRELGQVLGSMIDGWESGRFVMYPDLPGWKGLPWSFLLTPNWRGLIGRELGDVVAGQWASTTQTLLDDLEALPPDRWIGLDHDRFLADPEGETGRLCAFSQIGWDRELGQTLPLSRYTLTPPSVGKWRRHASRIEPSLERLRSLTDRASQASLHG